MNPSRPVVPQSIKFLVALAFWTTMLVILAGSIVRTTGSGLGCPDWPRCFGKWVPPTSVTELPLDYKTRFEVMGREIADFSAFKTWVEYTNRLLGVLLGMVLVLLSVVTLIKRKDVSSKLLWGAQAALFLVIMQGGLGAIVVATHLHWQTITLHLALAVALAVMLKRLQMAAKDKYFFRQIHPSKAWITNGRIVYVLALVQLILGTEVRKSIDHLVHEFVALPRAEWVGHLDWYFLVHRSTALVFVLAVAVWFWRSLSEGLRVRGVFAGLGFYMVMAITTGTIMRELGFPAWAQPLHLVFGVLLFVQVDRIYRLSN